MKENEYLYNILESNKLDKLMDEVIACSHIAVKYQSKIVRSFKSDGTILTKTDLEISTRIINIIKELFPTSNVISEEEITPFDSNAPYTFVLDPIDGTDVYSNGFPSFAVALGILDSNRDPVGAMIVAPRFGRAKEALTIRLDPGKKLLIDNEIVEKLEEDKDIIKQITISSKTQKVINFDNYNGKIRTFGSTIIHIICPVVFPFIQGCINQRAFIWDICASHAILRHLGFKVMYSDNTPLVYTDKMLIYRGVSERTIYCGTEKGIKDMMKHLPLKEGHI
ncbi:MAG: inositol monophosphatase [Spirochaetaceae bacterium]|nr:inositol monophosphatase [Spirochaetaceae bacterium]